MPSKKRSSRSLAPARKRLAGIVSISPTLDLGEDVSVTGLQASIADLDETLQRLNALRSDADACQVAVQSKEKHLRQHTARVLHGVAARYGEDSAEYEQAGGKRLSRRRRASPAAHAPAVVPTSPAPTPTPHA